MVGAGNAMGKEISDVAIIVKMIRVILLVPALLVISFLMAKGAAQQAEKGSRRITIPWFAVGFLVVIG